MNKSEEIGILLSAGLSKKQIAVSLKKSLHTVNQHARILYLRTNSHNLADITRYTIGKLIHEDLDKILYTESIRLLMENMKQDGTRPETYIRCIKLRNFSPTLNRNI